MNLSQRISDDVASFEKVWTAEGFHEVQSFKSDSSFKISNCRLSLGKVLKR